MWFGTATQNEKISVCAQCNQTQPPEGAITHVGEDYMRGKDQKTV